ncbi:hypothetical protein BpHYR1_000744 [Brachionus plicatilis]|uniref:Uncharacterized protein n=1 Tax=Brachionus plicatilis TaxID=10195 RepID=A0A3M7S2Y8_BRAPC|nr:hypothetical protein BpHYR1_000744 [Brachionus plicatilis]
MLDTTEIEKRNLLTWVESYLIEKCMKTIETKLQLLVELSLLVYFMIKHCIRKFFNRNFKEIHDETIFQNAEYTGKT